MRPGKNQTVSRALQILCAIFALCFLSFISNLHNATAAETPIPPAVDDSISRGLEFLANQQLPDGSFQADGPRVAVTSLSLMSFLASGHVPDEGKYGHVVTSAVECLLKTIPDDGYFGKLDGSRMYGQGITTMALAEACGADHNPARRSRIRAALERAAAVVFQGQDRVKAMPWTGGWRYDPESGDADLSLSGWNALAMRAAGNIGIPVKQERVDLALAFVTRCYRPDEGGFAYQPNQASSIAMTGVGMLNLFLLSSPDRPELVAAAKYLQTHPLLETTHMFYYSAYYSTQAAFQAGGETWEKVWPNTQARLLAMQSSQKDGGWPPSPNWEEPGRIYSTAMALLSLSVPYQLLPTYQR